MFMKLKIPFYRIFKNFPIKCFYKKFSSTVKNTANVSFLLNEVSDVFLIHN